MGKEYTIFIDSDSGTGTVNRKTYQFDWNIIPAGEYEFSFTFLSPLVKTVAADAESLLNVVQIEAVIPFSSNRYRVAKLDAAGFQSSSASSSNVIGFVKVEAVDKWDEAAGHFSMRHYISQLDNPTLKLYGVPSGNTFNINLLNSSGGAATHSPQDYNMILKLKHIC